MEYWSVEKKDITPLAIAPTLQYSNTPKLIGILFYSYAQHKINKPPSLESRMSLQFSTKHLQPWICDFPGRIIYDD
jgi:hypothetical protein